MSTVTGSKAAVEAVAAIRDRDAGLPSPYSFGKPPVNRCPECEQPVTPPPYRCPACGWDESRGYAKAKRCVARHVDHVREREDGTCETTVPAEMADEIKAAKSKQKGTRTERERVLAAVAAEAKPVEDPKPREEPKP